MREIRKAAVLGSGVMGASIAAHLANVGIPVILLDIVPKELTSKEASKGLTLDDQVVRNRLGSASLNKIKKQKPAPLTSNQNLRRIEVGNMTDDMERLSDVDWIIEVVVEDLTIKKQVLADVDRYRKEGSIISSNTSGISIHDMSEACSDDFKAHFLGTHFFNPPRYMKLLEVIPTKHTKTDVIQQMVTFGEDVLGKGVVMAKDTPNFIANRIGTYGLQVTVRELLDKGYSVGEVDSVTGSILGRAKSATFRTLDVVGLDTFVHVADNVRNNVNDPQEKQVFEIPSFVQSMLERGWVGSKAGQGFYLKTKSKEILQLNPNTMDYEPRDKVHSPSVEQAKQLKSTSEKIKALAYAEDRAGDIVWPILKQTLLYSAEHVYNIADHIHAVDLAMKWGFGWEFGPFETWDAIGLETSVERMKAEGVQVPAWIEDMLSKGYQQFYKETDGKRYYYHNGDYVPIKVTKKHIHLPTLKHEGRVIKKNTGASLIDLGDDVALLEFHSQNNAIGLDILQMIQQSVDEVEQNFKGLVIGNQSKNFCVGANLGLILMEAQDDNYTEIDMVVRKFQQAMLRLKYAQKPVVAAPFQMTLGGGAEVSLSSSAIQADMETYMGLVETGVGLIPGGGGNKELYLRLLNQIPQGIDVDLTKITNQVFEQIATANVATSAEEARENGFLRDDDRMSTNGDHLIYDAKQRVIEMEKAGYRAPDQKKIPVSGEAGYAAMVMGAKTMQYSGYASDHDLIIAKKLAHVLAGGRLPEGTKVDESYLLDLEREAFLSLVGEPKSQQRMQHMLMKGKPLRN
ncbi:3-hydroxyacyl-CoA dehydrogenase/enoyl-CoA hydratase family protein [Tuberibacillus sp. Marseille-P3662]|uniref:3-hydroxyacyl-CoA dehydrogenase/enoyl-CoA hydratase family protein n=1 Tax=Tuberibacillus sp. Marseille-P3662 TaxID=1965358 RepID=UPI0020CAE2D3|nr:3-hydroxyacyl-CoA dehydrogenase NAD-binding domain-containing protein [Tuberibacillus sp. Marseille-P3662]